MEHKTGKRLSELGDLVRPTVIIYADVIHKICRGYPNVNQNIPRYYSEIIKMFEQIDARFCFFLIQFFRIR